MVVGWRMGKGAQMDLERGKRGIGEVAYGAGIKLDCGGEVL